MWHDTSALFLRFCRVKVGLCHPDGTQTGAWALLIVLGCTALCSSIRPWALRTRCASCWKRHSKQHQQQPIISQAIETSPEPHFQIAACSGANLSELEPGGDVDTSRLPYYRAVTIVPHRSKYSEEEWHVLLALHGRCCSSPCT